MRVEPTNVAALSAGAQLLVDCLDNAKGRGVLSAYAREADLPLVHAAISADGTFGLVRWEEHFTADAEDAEGQATCEDGEHLPFIGLVAAALAAVVQEFVTAGSRRDLMIATSGITTTGHH